MTDTQCGSGLQVLSVEADGTYRADEAALRRVAEHEAARGLPVAVVSVAGATRGGKSFLLDFFLRYLRAPEAARRSGAWIGADDEPLTGFSWRGGCERDTKGILIWSEPFIVTLGSDENSEKVAVVLMDTQGTFDTSSTVRDSSTIFAVSTLLSSVQIYNLSQNIQEDDLQYLQLFTEYGKLVQDAETGTPFQDLLFLLRDWSYAYEYPLGAEGGQQLLEKRLEIRDEQAGELREIRAHVRSAFERVRCFLLPHPGLTVATSPHFKGCPADISPEFKNALLELVPLLFDPENLTIKIINGRKMTLQELTKYFETYVKIFNSDTLPTPMTVMQATSMACLEIALSASREAYCSHMELRADAPPPHGAAWVPRGAVPRLHGAALQAARDAFNARRKFAAPAHATGRFDALLQELDAMLPRYVAINGGRILETIAACKASYEEAVRSESCFSPDELLARHTTAADAAQAAFEASRFGPPEDDDDEDWRKLKRELEDLVPLYREQNEERIACAMAAARELYTARMRGGCAAAACLHPESLRALHGDAARDALDSFLSAWHDADTAPTEHKDALINSTEELYQEFVQENDANNNRVIEEALGVYDNIMSEIFGGEDGCCLHPRDLEKEHSRSQTTADAYFQEQRDPADRHLPLDHYRQSYNRRLTLLYIKFGNLNKERNENAVQKAHRYYMETIAPIRHGLDGVLEIFGSFDFGIFSRHIPSRNTALEIFKEQRRLGGAYDEDKHLDDLKKKIDETFAWLVVKLGGSVVLNAALFGSMFFFKR